MSSESRRDLAGQTQGVGGAAFLPETVSLTPSLGDCLPFWAPGTVFASLQPPFPLSHLLLLL